MKKLFLILLMTVTVVLVGCSSRSHKGNPNLVTVGTIAGPETELMEVAKKVALEKFGLHVKIIAFSSYTIPNQALEEGDIDVNAFQHHPYLLSQIKTHGYSFVSVGKTFLYPMGLYSKKVKNLSDLKAGAEIAIPNDPSNEARALLLLQKAGLIALKSKAGIDATIENVVSNPKRFKLIALDAAQLPRVLDDVALAAINTNYAIPAELSPSKDALFSEKGDSPHMNLLVEHAADKNEKKIKALVEAYQSE